MEFRTNFLHIITILGVVQGLVLAGILIFSKPPGRRANWFLALSVISMVLINFSFLTYELRLYKEYPLLPYLPNFYLAMGPALYFYTRCRLYPDVKLSKWSWAFFLPFLIEFFYHCLSFLFRFSWEPFSRIEAVLGIVLMAFFLAKSISLLMRVQKAGIYSSKKSLLLFKLLFAGYGVILLIAGVLVFYDILFYNFELGFRPYFPLLFSMTLLIYILGYAGYYKMDRVVEKTIVVAPVKPSFELPENLDIYLENIDTFMLSDKPWLDAGLSLQALANKLEINPKYLSFILKNALHKNFYNFINTYRVEEVKKRMRSHTHQQYSLLGIGLSCGFNSKTTFNTAFKKITGFTPSQYQKQVAVIEK